MLWLQLMIYVPLAILMIFLGRRNNRVVDKTVVTSLIKAGAFDEFESNRFKLLAIYFDTRKTKSDREEKEKVYKFSITIYKKRYSTNGA